MREFSKFYAGTLCKSDLVIEAIKGEKTINEIAAENNIMTERWFRTFKYDEACLTQYANIRETRSCMGIVIEKTSTGSHRTGIPLPDLEEEKQKSLYRTVCGFYRSMIICKQTRSAIHAG